MCKNNKWDRKISIESYKGTFKVEHFQMIETRFRVIYSLREISIIDTQMDKEHLTILKNLLQWLKPEKLKVELNNNELDDEDLEDFLYFLFESNLDLKRLYIINNPGIFKGNLFKQLKQKFPQKFSKFQLIYYELILNKECKSIAIVQIKQEWSKEEKTAQIVDSEKIIDQTCFYSLNLSGCFTDKNYKGFINLINFSYDQDNLEQIQALNVSNNYLGDQNSFTNACQLISTAKGLLDLKLRKVQQIQNSTAALALIGDRYDKLRLNTFDVSQNLFEQTKTLNIFANSIFLHCKEIYLNDNSLIDQIFQEKPQVANQFLTFSVIQTFKKAYQAQAKQFSKKSQQSGVLMRQSLKKFDLTDSEINQRNEFVQDLLENIVFSEHSNIKSLSCLVLRNNIHQYNKASELFMQKINEQNNLQLLHNFQLPLKQVSMKLQENIDIDILFDFFLRYCFTKQGDLVSIKHFTIEGDFQQSEPMSQISDVFKKIFNLNNQQRYTLKTIKFDNAHTNMCIEIFQCLLLNNLVELEELTIINDRFLESFSNHFSQTLAYLQQPSRQELNLRKLCLQNIEGEAVDIFQLIQLFFYDPLIRLEKIEIRKIRLKFDLSQQQKLEEYINQKKDDFEFSITELIFGEFQSSEAELFIFNYVLLQKFQKLQRLTLIHNQLGKNIKLIKNHFNKCGKNPFKTLNSLSLLFSQNLDQRSWFFILWRTVFAWNSALKELIFSNLTIDYNFKNALKMIALRRQKYKIFNSVQLKFFSIQECSIETEFISNLIMLECPLTTLEIIKCKGIDATITESKQICEAQCEFKNFKGFNLENLNFQDCAITLPETFGWFMENFAFKTGQISKLKRLNLKNSQLDDEKFSLLTYFIKSSQSISKDKKINLRTIDLQENNAITESSWTDFFHAIIQFEFNEQHQRRNVDIKQSLINQRDIFYKAQNNSDFAMTKLRITEKIQKKNSGFKPQYYKNLVSLSLSLEYQNFTNDQKQLTYQQVINTFIINQESQLNYLKLIGVDIILFVNSIDLNEDLKFKSKIQDLQFEMKNTSENQNLKMYVKRFVEVFIDSDYFDLQFLTLSKFHEADIIQSILNSTSKRQQSYVLKKLSLLHISEQLSIGLTLKFIEQILTCQKFKMLNFLELDKNILFDISGQSLKEFQLGNENSCPLQEFVATINSSQIEFYSKIMPIIFNENNQLKKIALTLDKDSLFNDIFKDLLKNFNDQISTVQFQIQEFKLQGKLKLDREMFEFILKISQKLKVLELSDLILDNFSIQKQIAYSLRSNSLLRINNIIGRSIQKFMECFIFNDQIGFEQLILHNRKSFYQLNNIQTCSKLKSIKLDMRLNVENEQLLDSNVMKLFAQQFIYNQESCCEEICFHKFKFQKSEISQLIQPAEDFRQRISRENLKRQMNLKLKKFDLRHESNLDDYDTEQIIRHLIYFEYISIEELTLRDVNLNDRSCSQITSSAKNWLEFQKANQRQRNHNRFPLKHLDLGENHFIQDQETWNDLLKTFVFSFQVQLSVCNFSDMSITDKISECFKEQSQLFFKQQLGQYNFRLHTLDLSNNYFLSKIGWQNMLKYFALHEKINITELNMNVTTEFENSQEITNEIRKCFQLRANLSQNRRVPIQRIYCQNENLKVLIQNYLSQPSQNQQLNYNFQQRQYENDFSKLGLYIGFAEKFGSKMQIYNQMLNSNEEFIEQTLIKNFEDLKFSYYQLNFSKHYLQILNSYYKKNNEQKISIFLSLLTLKTFCKIFQYCLNDPGEPFPYKLFFQKDTIKFLRSKLSSIYHIYLIQIEFANLEIIQQQDIFQLWLQIKETKIDQILVEYTMTDELCQSMLQNGFGETDIIQLVRLLPPSKLRLQGGLSLCALKGVYSILYQIPHFQYSIASYEFDLFLNTGIGYALRESVYDWKETNNIVKLLKRILYKVFNFFVTPTIKFKFDEEILHLNEFLDKNRLLFYLIATNNFLFWFVALIFPYILISAQLKEQNETTSLDNCSNISYHLVNQIYYFCFAPIFFIIETILIILFSRIIPRHLNQFELNLDFMEESAKEEERDLGIGDQQNSQHSCSDSGMQISDPPQNDSSQIFLPELFQDNPFDEGQPDNQISQEAQTKNQITETNRLIMSQDSQRIRTKLIKGQPQWQLSQTIAYKEIQCQQSPLVQSQFRNRENYSYQSSRRIVPQEILDSQNSSQEITIENDCLLYLKKKIENILDQYHMILYLQKKIQQFFDSLVGKYCYQLVSLIKSQLFKFDLFNDMIFILTCFYCQERTLFYIALLITSLNQLFYFIQILRLLFQFMMSKKQNSVQKQISTSQINQIYSLSLLGRNQAIADMLDKVAPFNVSIIPNNYILRKFNFKYLGKSISNPVMYYFQQFWFEDLPQTVLQTFFAIKQANSQGNLSTQIFIMVITTVFTLFSSFYSFMSIRPSTINQEDFDRLSTQKKQEYYQTKVQWLEKEKLQLQVYSEIL